MLVDQILLRCGFHLVHLLFFLAAILAVSTQPYFYSLQLLVLVQLSETLHNVVKAITMPAVALGMSALLAGICIYIFAFFGFWYAYSELSFSGASRV